MKQIFWYSFSFCASSAVSKNKFHPWLSQNGKHSRKIFWTWLLQNGKHGANGELVAVVVVVVVVIFVVNSTLPYPPLIWVQFPPSQFWFISRLFWVQFPLIQVSFVSLFSWTQTPYNLASSFPKDSESICFTWSPTTVTLITNFPPGQTWTSPKSSWIVSGFALTVPMNKISRSIFWFDVSYSMAKSRIRGYKK